MYDIVTIGSGTRDAFVEVPFAKIFKHKSFITGKGLCFSLGSKLKVPKIIFTTGGGATNTAVFFALQNFRVATICRVGNDVSGQTILKELKKFKVDIQFIQIDKKFPTAYSIILTSSQKGERTILVFRGNKKCVDDKLINFNKIKTRWFYVSSVAGNFRLLRKIWNHAKRNKTKILYNPGSDELKAGLKKLKPFLKKVDILILNQEEASYLTKIPYSKEMKIFQKLMRLTNNIVVMTKGINGVIVSDKHYLYKAGILQSKVIDRTGAGDAFGAGFLAGLLQKNSIPYAIQLGTANATSIIKTHGAKIGLLKKGQKFKKVLVNKIKL